MYERFVVIGVAPARAAWFGELGRLSTAGVLPIEFVRCISVDEVRARLDSGRVHSAVIVDAALAEVDRDLVDAARRAGCAVLIVDDERRRRDWGALGAHAVLPRDFGRTDLLDVLTSAGQPVRRADRAPAVHLSRADLMAGARLVAVTGPAGTGRSTMAMAVAQGLAKAGQRTVLADLALRADQAMLHGTGDVIPGLPELVDAHRAGVPGVGCVDDLTFDIVERGYDLLLGLRRPRDWVGLRARAVEQALITLRRDRQVVVVDVDADVDGAAETGSLELEERNVLARTALGAADVVLVVGRPGVQGASALVRCIGELTATLVPIERVVPVLNGAPRSSRARHEWAAAVHALAPSPAAGARLTTTVHVPHRDGVERAQREARRLPEAVVHPVTRAVTSALARSGPVAEQTSTGPTPVPITPGSLGRLAVTEHGAVEDVA